MSCSRCVSERRRDDAYFVAGLDFSCSAAADGGLLGSGRGHDGCGTFDDTLPLGEDEIDTAETQFLGEVSNLDGETQVLDHQDCVGISCDLGGNGASVMAQMTLYGDTEAIEDDQEGSEGTAVLCEDDEHSDGVATPCTLPSMTCLSESGKRDFSLDAEAFSTAEVGRSGQFLAFM